MAAPPDIERSIRLYTIRGQNQVTIRARYPNGTGPALTVQTFIEKVFEKSAFDRLVSHGRAEISFWPVAVP